MGGPAALDPELHGCNMKRNKNHFHPHKKYIFCGSKSDCLHQATILVGPKLLAKIKFSKPNGAEEDIRVIG